MTRVLLIGVGLIGGSVGMALRRVRRGGRRVYFVEGASRSAAHLRTAKRRGAIDAPANKLISSAAHADLILLAVPVHLMAKVLRPLVPSLKKGAIVTDVGSIKESVQKEISRLLLRRRDVSFVGAHPVAGSEKSGVEFAQADLFKGERCIITPGRAPKKSVDAIESLWRSVGAKTLRMDARRHDAVLAVTSHLPHLLSFALFSVALKSARALPLIKTVAAGSFRDMTRVAASDPDLWTGVLSLNRKEIHRAGAEVIQSLQKFKAAKPAQLRKVLAKLSAAKKSW